MASLGSNSLIPVVKKLQSQRDWAEVRSHQIVVSLTEQWSYRLMSSQDAESIASRYVRTIGRTAGERYHLVGLLGHCTRLGELRLELFRALQSSLSSSGETGTVVELN